MRKIFVVGTSIEYANWMKGTLVSNIEDADLVVFTGGEDIHPSLYNEALGKFTSTNLRRDMIESEYWEKATKLNKHIIGICRGSQLSCALSGGRLVQHQNNPKAIHDIITFDGKRIPITSSHHQAQYPYDMNADEYKLLAWTEGMSSVHLDGTNKEINSEKFLEAEVVYYPKTKALGIQGHPEWMAAHSYKASFEWLDNILNKHLEDSL